ncbi:MAG TPA: response regulator transcription factor [Candidatus Binataceae bacterium]|nr:response regulator transcription factor [Candidatus Binataceae bacterium]
MGNLSLLMVEDEDRLAENLRRGLGEEGFAVDWVSSAEDAQTRLGQNTYDLILLDLRLPGRDGLDFLRELRRQSIAIPVLILTARGSVEERVTGLDSGADDYLTKPFAFAELLARVRALARRRVASPAAVLKVADLELDTIKRKVWRAGREIGLSPKETILLELLMRNAGQVVTRDMIAEVAWGAGYNEFTNLIEVFVNRLRQKIDYAGRDSLIVTVRGAGYSLRR